MNEELEKFDENKTTAEPVEGSRREATMDDVNSAQRYIDLKLGSEATITTAKIEVVEDDKFCLSNSKNDQGHSYKIVITTTEGMILSVTAWDLWNRLRAAFKLMDKLLGVTVKIGHPEKGLYKVEYLKGKTWTTIK